MHVRLVFSVLCVFDVISLSIYNIFDVQCRFQLFASPLE